MLTVTVFYREDLKAKLGMLCKYMPTIITMKDNYCCLEKSHLIKTTNIQ